MEFVDTDLLSLAERKRTMTVEPSRTNDRDLHTTAGKLADLQRRVQEATHAGSARAVEKQHAKG
ncbi:hypothetical protein, partial [Streptomyces sp. NPDC058739]|uniref:hypothetical protein n=1 Tax=Streptomyces sp. NPDC058739 TaxID=3346618 RepID=UPI003697D5C0